MKKIKYLIAALMLCAPLLVNADSLSDNKAKSDQYKQELKILNQEIKTLKAKQKLHPEDSSLASPRVEKKAQLAEVKNKKKIIDEAIKTEKASQKAADAAQKAKEKSEKATKKLLKQQRKLRRAERVLLVFHMY